MKLSQHDYNSLRLLAAIGNIVFVLWVLFNWMDEANFQASTSDAMWFGGFILLLLVDTALLFFKNPVWYIAMAGNLFYAAYFLLDGLTNWTAFTGPEALSHVALVVLFALNSYLLYIKE